MTVLKTAPLPNGIDLSKAMAVVERRHGIGRYRQLGQIARAGIGAQRMTPGEYYEYGLFRPDIPAELRARFVSEKSNTALNRTLSPADLGAVPAMVRDKALCGRILAGFGFPVPPVVALYSADGRYGRLNDLRSAADMDRFLSTNDRWPLFAKPTIAGQGIGAASFAGRDGRHLVFGNGEGVDSGEFAAWAARSFPEGYVFQEFLHQHPNVEAVTGPAVGVLRVVTVRTGAGPQFLYAVWKFPGAGAMSDGAQTGATETGMGLVDPSSETVVAAHFGDWLHGPDGRISPVTGAAIVGTRIPDFAAARALAVEAHHAFPTHGVIGWDMILTPKGPVIGETNPNPFHQLVQRASGRPLVDPAALATLAEARAHVARRRADSKRPGTFLPWTI